VIIDERAHPGRQPLDAELFAAAPVFKFLNATVGEIHLDSSPPKGPAPVPVEAEYADTPCTRARHTEQESDTPGWVGLGVEGGGDELTLLDVVHLG
jgi:hypothetical protein